MDEKQEKYNVLWNEEYERERERANDKQTKKPVFKDEKKSNYDESKFCQRLKYILQSLTFQMEDQNTAVLCSVERVSARTHLKEIIILKVLLNKWAFARAPLW